jgi:biotin carboxylase
MTKTILLVNPLSSSHYISQALKDKGFFTIALFTISYNKIDLHFRAKSEFLDKQIYLDTFDIEQVLSVLSPYKIDFILNGYDDSLLVTEDIIKKLIPLYNNDENTRKCRSNKFEMQEAFKAKGLPYIKQIKIDCNREEFISMKIHEAIGFPCFAKPVLGAASIGASFCNSYEDLVEKLKHKQRTVTNQLMDEYIVQEVIEGEEVFVDTFSVNGEHYVSSVQTISKKKIDNSPCYRTERLVYDKEIWTKAGSLVKKALDACGIRTGFSHTELFYLKDGGFRIIEINPRHSGAQGLPNNLAKYQGLNTQIDLLASYLNNEKLSELNVDAIQGYGEILYLYNFRKSPTKNISPQINDFRSVVKVIQCNLPGTTPPSIKNLGNVDCMLMLYDKDSKQSVRAEAANIWELEAAGLLL